MSNTIAVSEIFGPTVQGEGALIGKPTVFVRTGGCDYQHCSWCDTLYAVLPEYKGQWMPMEAQEIFAEVQQLSPTPILVTLSGGNPAIQPLEPLLDIGHAHGYTFGLETQGSIYKSWFTKLDYLTLSPKPPSSSMKTRWDRLDRCFDTDASICLKVVVFDDADYAYAQEVQQRYPTIPMYLQPGNATPPHIAPFDMVGVLGKLEWLIGKVTAAHWNTVTVLPQLHTIVWGNKQGV